MSYIKIETITKRTEIKDIKRNFFSFKKLNNFRKDIDRCQNCSGEFTDDNVNLATVKNSKNIVICDSCAELMLGNGAREI